MEITILDTIATIPIIAKYSRHSREDGKNGENGKKSRHFCDENGKWRMAMTPPPLKLKQLQ
jgi:hypothetical protein